MKEKNNNFLVIMLIIIIMLLSAYIVIDKFVALSKEQSPKDNKIIEEEKKPQTNDIPKEDDNAEIMIQDIVGVYKGSLNSVKSEGEPMTAYFELTINQDESCKFSRGVSGGSGWSASGNCILKNSKITLNSNSVQNDAEEYSENKTYSFTMNLDGSINYYDGLGNVTLIKE